MAIGKEVEGKEEEGRKKGEERREEVVVAARVGPLNSCLCVSLHMYELALNPLLMGMEILCNFFFRKKKSVSTVRLGYNRGLVFNRKIWE